MRLPRSSVALLLLGLLACPARPPEAAGEVEETPAAQREDEGERRAHPDDDALPAPEEIPSFLAPRLPPREVVAEEAQAPTAPDEHEPEAWEPNAGLGFLSVRPAENRDPADPETPAHDSIESGAERELLSLRPGESRDPVDPPTDESPVPAEAPAPCQDLRDAIARHQAYLHRIHDERRAYGWVEDHEDGAALRLLEGLRRCEAHPEDPDCLPPPLVADLGDRTLDSHEFSRDPSDLNAEGREPDEIPHDPRMLDLLERLRRCEAAQAQRSPFPLPGP